MATNLETLELTIASNAESASQGLSNLINSLSALTKPVGKAFSGLKMLNAELAKLKGYGSIKIPGVSATESSNKATNNFRKTTKAYQDRVEAIREWQKAARATRTFLNHNDSMMSDAELRRRNPQWFVDYSSPEGQAMVAARNDALLARGNQLAIASDPSTLKALNKEVAKSPSIFQKAKSALSNLGAGMKKFGGYLKGVVPQFKLLHRIGRMFTTMLIRSGIKAFFKYFKEGMNNYYQYSKGMNGGFAQAMDSMASTFAQLKNQMSASIAPVFAAAIPVINALASAAITAFNALSQLLALLSGKSTWSRAKAQVTEFGKAAKEAGGGGGGLKELLAQFDELNVIASESGGGGGGGGIADDYADMFEEMSIFDDKLLDFAQKIRDLIGFIKDNFKEILAIAGLIGAAILGWKMASALGDSLGLLSKILGLLGAGAVIALTIVATWELTNKYLETGEIGWLIADALTTALGATAAWYIAKQMIGGKAGYWAASITLALSALTGITALLTHTDVGALDKRSILVAIENALKAGAAAFILGKGVFSLGTDAALMGAGGTALITFGAVIGLKAILDKRIDSLSTELIEAALLAAIPMGSGLFLVGKGFFNKTFSEALALGAGAAFVTFGAVVGIKALLDEKVEGLSNELIEAALLSAVSVGGGLFTIGKGFFGKTLSESFALGIGSAFITFGAVVGIKALLDKNVEGLSEDMIRSAIISSVAVGAGLFAIEKGFFGKMASTAFLIAAGGAFITFGALIGIKTSLDPNIEMDSEEFIKKTVISAMLTGLGVYLCTGNPLIAGVTAITTFGALIAIRVATSEKHVDWGEVELTIDEMKEYIKSKAGFDVYLEAHILDVKILNFDEAKERLNSSISDLQTKVEKIRLNVDTSEAAITAAKEQADTVISELKTYLSSSSNLLDSLFSNLGYSDEEKTSIWSNVNFADTELNKYFEEQGKKIADAYDRGISSGWKENEQEEILALMEHLENIVTGADLNTAFNTLQTKLKLGMTGFSEETARDILKESKEAFEEYASSLEESAQKTIESLYYRADLAEGAGLTETAAKLRADAQFLIDTYQDATNEKLKAAKAEMKTEWEAALLDIYGSDYNKAITNHIGEGFQKELKERLRKDEESAKQLLTETLQRVVNVNSITSEATELFDIQGWDLLSNQTKERYFEAVYNAVGVEAVKLLKETLNISAFDLIEISNWKEFSLTAKLDFVAALGDAFGSVEAIQAAKSAGIDVGKLINEGISSQDQGAISAAQSLVNQIRTTLASMGVHVPVDATVDVLVNALVQVTATSGSTTVTAAGAGVNMGSLNPKKNRQDLLKASGAYNIPQGDVFIANEAGAELVGSINGRTSVANQEQIVEGIQRGVAEANSEQNALLRRQNELLQAILNKDASVRFGASVALGRTVRQSLNMYDSVTGG